MIVNVGSGTSSTIAEVARELGESLNVTPTLREVGEFRVGDVHSCIADPARMSRVLGVEAAVSLAEGLREFVVWAANEEISDGYERATEELRSFGLFAEGEHEAAPLD